MLVVFEGAFLGLWPGPLRQIEGVDAGSDTETYS